MRPRLSSTLVLIALILPVAVMGQYEEECDISIPSGYEMQAPPISLVRQNEYN